MNGKGLLATILSHIIGNSIWSIAIFGLTPLTVVPMIVSSISLAALIIALIIAYWDEKI